MSADPGIATGERSRLSNGAIAYFSTREGGAKRPVDLPLRLDNANASSTTPEGPQQQVICIE
jgi:hypothetical protein